MQYSHCQQISAGKDRAKICIIKKEKGERVGKRVAYHLVLCHWTDPCTVGVKQERALLRHACPIFEELKRSRD